MNSHRKIASIVGALFLIAMVTSLLGAGLIESVINTPNYLTDISADTTQLTAGVFLELINALAVVGIGVMMFTILQHHNESIALGYVGFRLMESIFLTVAAIIPLSLITLSQEYLHADVADAPYFQTLGGLLKAGRADVTGLLIPIFFSLGALLFYYLLYQSKLIPRFISVWGLIGTVLILLLNLIEISFSLGMILALPIILNEIFLGIWLIVKGFNLPTAAAGSAAKQ